MIRKLLLLLCLAGATAEVKSATITWQAATDAGFALGPGVMLEINSLVRIGLFDVSEATVEANANDLSFLQTHFIQLDTDRIGGPEVANSAGYFSNQFSIDTRASQNSLGGQLLYVWAYKSSDNSSVANSIATVTNASLITLNTTAWQLPTDSEVAPATLSIDVHNLLNSGGTALAGANSRVIQGSFPVVATGALSNNHFGLVAIPEPSSMMLAGVGLLVLARRRR